MVYALSQEVYNQLYGELTDLRLDAVTEYFNVNWHPIRMEWVACFTKHYHHYSNHTTNRVESLNSKLKSVVTKYASLQNFLVETVQFLKSTFTESDYRTISKRERKPIVTEEEDVFVSEYRKLLTEFAFVKVQSQIDSIILVVFTTISDTMGITIRRPNNVNVIYVTKNDSCDCGFFNIMKLPCKHMFAFWDRHERAMFVPDACDRRWFKSSLPTVISDESLALRISNDGATIGSIPTSESKFRKANKVGQKIATAISQMCQLSFESNMKSLGQFERFVEIDAIFKIDSTESTRS